MTKFRRWIPGFLALVMAAGTCLGEDAEPAKFYKLEFVVKEVEGTKVLNSRAYSMVAGTGNSKSEIRAGSRVRYAVGQGPSSNYQVADVGVNIDAIHIEQVQNRLSFVLAAEINSLGEDPSSSAGPAIRSNRWNSEVIVPLNKPTVVVSSDTLDSKTKMQIELTAIAIP